MLLQRYCEKWSLTVNTTKTKTMLVTTDRLTAMSLPQLTYSNNPLEWVNDFTYLGVSINNKGMMQTKAAPIWNKATRAQFKLAVTGRSLSFDTKAWLHQMMVDPILMHGVEIWACQGRLHQLRTKGVFGTYNDQGVAPLPGEESISGYKWVSQGKPLFWQ